MARTKKRSLYVALQATNYFTDPSANGSSYLYVPALTVGAPEDTSDVLDTDFATGRNFATAAEPGADGATLSFTTPLIGLATAAGDGTNASTVGVDWFHTLLEHTFGGARTTAGEGVAASSTTTSLILDTATYTAQDLIPVFETGLPSAVPRTQWVKGNSVATATWAVSPTMAAAPTTNAVAYGSRIITPDDDGGAPLAAVVVDDDLTYTLLGGRVTSLSWEVEAGKIWRANWSVRFDTKTLDAGKSSLPAVTAGPAVTSLKGFRSPANFNNVFYGTRRVAIDFGIESAIIGDTAQVNGRAGDEAMMFRPKVTIEPLRTDALVNLKRAQTLGQLQIQIGAGILSGGVLNTMCVDFDRATAKAVSYSDESGRTRQVVEITMADRAIFTGSTASLPFQIARA